MDPETLLAVIPYLQAHVRMGGELSLVREAGKALAADPTADLAEWMSFRGACGPVLLDWILGFDGR